MCAIVYSKVIQVLAMYRSRSGQVNGTPKEGLYSVENCSSELSAGMDGG